MDSEKFRHFFERWQADLERSATDPTYFLRLVEERNRKLAAEMEAELGRPVSPREAVEIGFRRAVQNFREHVRELAASGRNPLRRSPRAPVRCPVRVRPSRRSGPGS